MHRKLRPQLSFANVVSVIALFVALGAGAYAAGLRPNSVKSKHIVNGQVKGQDVADDAVGSPEVIDESLGGQDIAEDTLPTVPTADNANELDGKDSTEFAAAGSEGWQALTLKSNPANCHWQNFDPSFNPPAFFRDRAGVVHLRGMITAVDGTTSNCGFNAGLGGDATFSSALPQGYRPANIELFTITAGNKPGRLDWFPDGQPFLGAALAGYPSFADLKNWLSLDGVSFRCAPSGQNGCP